MEQKKIERKTETITLPISGDQVVIKAYLTIGEARQLQKVLLAQGNLNSKEGKLNDIPAETVLQMQDKAAEILIVSVISGEDKQSVYPFSYEWLENLHVKDGTLIYDRINTINEQASASPEAKKN